MKVSEFWGFSPKSRPAARLNSLLMAVEPGGKYDSFWPMPRRELLSVELMAIGLPARVRGELTDTPGWLQPEHLYFHAHRITDRTEKERDIRLLEARGRGHFVGAILELASATLEGDDRFYVDGEAFPPAWHGTGTEDYFRCGWYFHGGALSRPLYGLLAGLYKLNQRKRSAGPDLIGVLSLRPCMA
jgi:hypothetical protein